MISVSEPVSGSEPVAAVYDRRNEPVSPLDSVGGHRPPLQQQTAPTKTESAIRHPVGGHRPPLQTGRPPRLHPPCTGY